MQKDVFLSGEGNGWYSRNKEGIEASEYKELIEKIQKLDVVNGNYLEVGCSNGGFLTKLSKVVEGKFTGIDPSEIAIKEGIKLYPELKLIQGTADKLEVEDKYDVIIFGFCLYLCDPIDLFKIAYEVDARLKDGGYVVIKDFYSDIPYKNEYVHLEGVYSHKMDYTKMFLWNPLYRQVSTEVYGDKRDALISISVVKKRLDEAYLDGSAISNV